ncbi:BNR repeat-containing protein [Crateriforma spongiae]|uniref:BNR repeat-containing protein n=1 Tax=Crateriforma spongiae TaxID=2724528 RepID=UPI001447F738|nr:BNR repeat-containing protein [Crateriforma spongiae]
MLGRFVAVVFVAVQLASITDAAEPKTKARGQTAGQTWNIAQTWEIDHVPASFPVGFCLLTDGPNQYVAYYDEDHQMVVACRRLHENQWDRVVLPSKVGWDSHNYITMAVDSRGSLHVSGNMHAVPLVYFRTDVPGQIQTLRSASMTGNDEDRCTYPRFLQDADGNLLYTYRSGGSGNGRRLYNRFDSETGRWHRFLDVPLFDGLGQCNAYPIGPTQGPDGHFHVSWVWRDTPDCATNHDLSYARSADLKHWETAHGSPLRLPITPDQTAAVVDPVPSGGGIINSGIRMTFDRANQPLLAYHKRDANGHMQAFVATPRKDHWLSQAITDWDAPILFAGRGSMPFIGIKVSTPKVVDEKSIVVGFRHQEHGSGRIVLDAGTLRPVDRKVTIEREFPPTLSRVRIDFPGMQHRLTTDIGASPDADERYVLRWETLGSHHDRRPPDPLPPPSKLQLVRLVRGAVQD